MRGKEKGTETKKGGVIQRIPHVEKINGGEAKQAVQGVEHNKDSKKDKIENLVKELSDMNDCGKRKKEGSHGVKSRIGRLWGICGTSRKWGVFGGEILCQLKISKWKKQRRFV